MIYSSSGLPWAETDEITAVETGLSGRVILFDDDEHMFHEVVEQLILATGCSFVQAESLTFDVHRDGSAVVFEGSMQECLRVSAVLEEINLHTQVSF